MVIGAFTMETSAGLLQFSINIPSSHISLFILLSFSPSLGGNWGLYAKHWAKSKVSPNLDCTVEPVQCLGLLTGDRERQRERERERGRGRWWVR